MKNKDLIEKLKEYNPEADVTLIDSEDITISYISIDNKNKKNTTQLFIEGIDYCQRCVNEYVENNVTYCSFYNLPCNEVEECYQYEEEE